jgi:AcrR family transcriptional regulator
MVKHRPRQQQRDEMIEAIKQTARQQMASEGTAAISLRAIARALDVTAPALYRYFTDRDDLVTDLIIDAFNAHADAMDAADAEQPRDDYAARMIAALIAYRRWALEHPTDFQLIYGTPIPGYHAPREVTVPAASRPFHLVIEILGAAYAEGILQPPAEFLDIPDDIQPYLADLSERDGYHQPLFLLYIATVGWSRIYGMVMLELLDNSQPIVGKPDSLYQSQVIYLCKNLNLLPKS